MPETAKLTIKLNEPVAASRRLRTEFVHDAYDHIPGSVLRGALAAVWIREYGPPTTESGEFLEIFEGDGSFGPLHSAASVPVPISFKQHKYTPKQECDRRWDRARDEDADQCYGCGDALEASKGEPAGTVARTSRTRVELTTEGVAKDGDLFRQRAISKGTVLHGWVYGPAVRALALDGHEIDRLQLGGRRSVQGGAELTVDSVAAPPPVEQVDNSDGTTDVILRLLSPGVFVDDLGMPSAKPCLAELSDVLDVSAHEVVGDWTRWTEVGGWHAASGLPKPVERAVQAGSTYRIRCDRPATEENLRRLMARGIGLRRREGFGALYDLSLLDAEEKPR